MNPIENNTQTVDPALPPKPKSKKSNAPKCGFGCGDRAVKIIGNCRYCTKNFCGRHRLPEAHACENINHCRQESATKNADRLMGERTVANKVL
ncbi:hypothetical protein BC833DRAFT_576409 [Globomyces pollinis-pini]|nr:hypothetical protein BC833DRAFT_576409 [Globomyces pollinis-pini]KAJ2998633.1 hypothetical protein HDV02_004263 [Globomyces sp. JEL0801]